MLAIFRGQPSRATPCRNRACLSQNERTDLFTDPGGLRGKGPGDRAAKVIEKGVRVDCVCHELNDSEWQGGSYCILSIYILEIYRCRNAPHRFFTMKTGTGNKRRCRWPNLRGGGLGCNRSLPLIF